MPDMRYLLLLYLLFCAAIFLYDHLFRRVPNSLLLMAIVTQLAWLVVSGSGLNGVTWTGALSGFALGLFFFLPLYALRAMAAGDVKFFAVLGLLLGPGPLLPIFLIASAMAGVYAVAIRMWRMGLAPGMHIVAIRVVRWPWYQRVLERRGNRIGIPYAAYLALAAAWAGMHSAGIVPGFT
ncbi:prepilin peptidase [Collimonas pratensis]|uniref:Type IV leader peptidase family protein n=1 Tax=Collimonas pratensis TaxID=279113 RepID=A0ABN4M964_9BURK|nr:A24 family peptidase [Collimonas pratensis]AMP13194.1 type IV leader peptidase family protein [Collimonas pratensis]